MAAPFRASRIARIWLPESEENWFRLTLEEPGETFEPGEIHARRKRCARRDQDDPEQPEADAHLIPGMTPRCERQKQGRPERFRPLLGFEIRSPDLPCAISVPNLIADRPGWVRLGGWNLNVRRLMYQPLIWLVQASDDARRLGAPLDAQGLEREADALVDRVRRDFELGRNLFRRKVLVDEQQAVELAPGELGDSLRHVVFEVARIPGPRCHIHEHISEQTVPNTAGMTRVRNNLRRFGSIEQFGNGVLAAFGCSAQPSSFALTHIGRDVWRGLGRSFAPPSPKLWPTAFATIA
jgi:hypothetical protein